MTTTPARRIVLTALLFMMLGPLIAAPVTVPVIWYSSIDGMTAGQALISGLVVTTLGFWAVIAFGAVPAIATGLTVGWLDARYGMTGIWIPVAAAALFGFIWGMVIQSNVSEFVAVTPAVMLGAIPASIVCWKLAHWARARRAGRRS